MKCTVPSYVVFIYFKGSGLLNKFRMPHRRYKKLLHELPWESPQASPRSVASSDHSNTQSPPSAWSLPAQSDSSSQQGTAWNQASSTDCASPSMSNQYTSQSRIQHSSFLNDGQTRQVIGSVSTYLGQCFGKLGHTTLMSCNILKERRSLAPLVSLVCH